MSPVSHMYIITIFRNIEEYVHRVGAYWKSRENKVNQSLL